ncbi:reverse transcriptase [Trichonephila clavipes]|nr:reverse transcriptase [Trichonephila clavipes]
MDGLRPYSGSQDMLKSLAMKEPTKKPSRERSRFNRKSPLPSEGKKNINSTHIDKYAAMTQKMKSFGKPWETLTNVGPIPRHLERAEAVARFHLTTGQDFLGVYLHWLGVDANEACPFSGHVKMDGAHLLQCTGLVEYPTDDIVSWYWEAWHQEAKPSTGIG